MTLSQPQISVNKLGEYIVCRAARQRKILHDRKYPDPDFQMGMYHREASEAVAAYLADGAVDSGPIATRMQALAQQSSDKIATQRRLNANIDAMERFLGMLDDVDLGSAEAVLGAHAPPKITFHGVQISVRPEIVLRATSPKGKKFVAAIKLHFSKSAPMNVESAGYVSAVVQEYARLHLASDDETVLSISCAVMDVASGQVFPGVKSTAARIKDVASACQNIAALWPTI